MAWLLSQAQDAGGYVGAVIESRTCTTRVVFDLVDAVAHHGSQAS
jgi:hypothetical protein